MTSIVIMARRTMAIVTSLFAMSPAIAETEDFVELPRDLEIELALSALPAELQDDATIYIRDPKRGYVIHRNGTNGWATFVARTSARFYEADWEYHYPSDILIPQAHDMVGQAHHMRPYFDLALMRINDVPPAKAKDRLRRRFGDGTYTAPKTGGMSYMLAPIHRAYLAPAQSDTIMTFSFPHHMPYAPNMPTGHLGGMDPHNRSGTLDHGGTDTGPHGYFYFMAQADQVEAIRIKYAGLLSDLCEHHEGWCIPKN